MARPLKRSADYFPHSAALRNTPEAKALRARFGLEGYAIYTMLMELLCGSDDFTHVWDDLNIELLAADFGVSGERLQEVSLYLARLKMVEIDNEKISSKKLESALQPVIEKRIRMQERYNSEVSAAEKSISAAETPQRKGKERKGKESNNNLSFDLKESERVRTAENTDTPHPAETALLQWAEEHTEWLRNPIKEFEIKKAELDSGSITGELRKMARYYLTKAKPHVRARFETDPGDFCRNSWRDWLRNISERRRDKQEASATAKKGADMMAAELQFTEEEIFAIAVAAVGREMADELHQKNKLFYPRKAKDKVAAREIILKAAKDAQKAPSAARSTAPAPLSAFIQ